MSRLSYLLPNNIGEAIVVPELRVAGYPRECCPPPMGEQYIYRRAIVGTEHAEEFQRFRSSFGPRILYEQSTVPPLPTGHSIVVVDKVSLHALYDLMFMYAGPRILCSAVDLPQWVLQTMCRFMHAFSDYIGTPHIAQEYDLMGGSLLAAYNYDCCLPDKRVLMPFKRFHLHANYLDRDLVAQVRDRRVPFASVVSADVTRQLVEPAVFVLTQVLVDYATRHLRLPSFIRMLTTSPERDIREKLPFGLKFEIRDGWHSFGTSALAGFLGDLHVLAQRVYTDISCAFTGAPRATELWQRPPLLDRQSIRRSLRALPGLSEGARGGLMSLALLLADIPPRVMEYLRARPSLASRLLAFSGMAYSVTVTEGPQCESGAGDGPRLMLCLCPKLFSDTGGAGVFGLAETSAILVKRGAGVLTSEAMRKRRGFQLGFVDHLTSRLPSDGAALPKGT